MKFFRDIVKKGIDGIVVHRKKIHWIGVLIRKKAIIPLKLVCYLNKLNVKVRVTLLPHEIFKFIEIDFDTLCRALKTPFGLFRYFNFCIGESKIENRLKNGKIRFFERKNHYFSHFSMPNLQTSFPSRLCTTKDKLPIINVIYSGSVVTHI